MNRSRTSTAFPVGRTVLLGGFLAVLAAGCTTRRVERPDRMAGMAATLSVERFLQASNARDYDAMARIFGTREGPVAETGGGGCGGLGKLFGGRCQSPEDVERWMAAISEILRYDDYKIVSERAEPGREHPASRIGVDLTRSGRVVPDVGFVVVQGEEGGWLVESVDLEKVTSAG